jgi:DNA-binding MarR family transcriptional regulator
MAKNAWISLRDFFDQATAKTGYDQLDTTSQRLLEWIITRYDANPQSPIYIQTAVLRSEIASPATIFKCTNLLQRKKMISVTPDSTDARRKLIEPSEKARDHLKELSRLALEWAKKHAPSR